MQKFYRSNSFFFGLVFLFIFLAFFRTYFAFFPTFEGSPAFTVLLHFHVLTLIAWFLMLIVQPLLIWKGKIDLHRKVGKSSYLLVPLILLGFGLVINQEQSRAQNLIAFAANLFDIPFFLTLYVLAIYYRKNAAYHQRFMILSALPFLDPASARIALPGVPIILVVILLLLIREYFGKRVYAPYWIALGISILLFGVLGNVYFIDQRPLIGLWNWIWA
jgi:hypothetical protein